MRTHQTLRAALVSVPLATTGALVGCAASGNADAGAPLRAPVRVDALEGEWTLVALRGEELGDLEALGVRRPPHLTIADDGAAGGSAGVNRLAARLVVRENGGATFTQAITTKMAGPPGAMDLEARYLLAINAADAVRVSDERLVFFSKGVEVLRFARSK